MEITRRDSLKLIAGAATLPLIGGSLEAGTKPATLPKIEEPHLVLGVSEYVPNESDPSLAGFDVSLFPFEPYDEVVWQKAVVSKYRHNSNFDPVRLGMGKFTDTQFFFNISGIDQDKFQKIINASEFTVFILGGESTGVETVYKDCSVLCFGPNNLSDVKFMRVTCNRSNRNKGITYESP